jgi:hypothetical protein
VDECKPLPLVAAKRAVGNPGTLMTVSVRVTTSIVRVAVPLLPTSSVTEYLYQGLTLVHPSAQRQRFWWDKGYLGGV